MSIREVRNAGVERGGRETLYTHFLHHYRLTPIRINPPLLLVSSISFVPPLVSYPFLIPFDFSFVSLFLVFFSICLIEF